MINAFAGRLRLRIPRLKNDPTYASEIENKVKELNFITSVRVNPVASSLVITYAKRRIAASEAESRLLAAIACLDPTNAPSTLEAESTPENSVLHKLDSQQQDLHSEEIALETASESPNESESHKIDSLNHSEQIESLPDEIISSTDSEPIPTPSEDLADASEELVISSTASEPIPTPSEDLADASEELITSSTASEPIPTPSEDLAVSSEELITSSTASEPASASKEVAVAAFEEESVSIVSSVKSAENDSIKPNFTPARKRIGISHRELARRLGVSSRAIAIWRSKPNFTQWSMTKDPEQIGWVYIKPLNKFYAVIEK
ncbi:HMA2 domain-containing protein [Pleurocapsa sp. PCC 7327]|uniref:HMA2 domain-containing protein n=1 Tax=Pleurocapsa sp. PCC 7327 TaxID=118163 RepID=UPI0002E6D55A|nr:hypothetical protein [Pleurocapsa sp. PCC 7327]